MTEIGEVGVRKRRSRQEIKRLVREFETSGLRRSEFCHKHNLALGTLQRGLRKRRMEVDGQSESKRLVEVKMAGIQRNGSGPGTCSLEVVLAEGRRIEVRRDFDAETLARLIRTLEEIWSVFGLGPATRIYVALGATDMRKGYDGLYGLVRDKLGLEVRTGHLFLFANARRNRLKILYWDGTGLWSCAKRLERGRFSWPVAEEQSDRVMLSHEELSLLLGGIDLTRTRRKDWYRKTIPDSGKA
jgi:transposase